MNFLLRKKYNKEENHFKNTESEKSLKLLFIKLCLI